MRLASIIVGLVCISANALTIGADKVCYIYYGCFRDDQPYGSTLQRPIGALPQSPQEINTTFNLFTRNNRQGELITRGRLGANFDPSLPTKFITHGFLSKQIEPWMLDMTNALLDKFNVNVVYVNWASASGFPYQQAVANIQIVGIEIADVIKGMVRAGASSKDVHLIGHSLGAHASGFAGKLIKIGRISGLDPAGPYHEDTPESIRLSSNDADFVDVIHTNAMNYPTQIGFGFNAPIGHVDFYPNGGRCQPGCAPSNLEAFDALGHILQTFDIDAAFEKSIGCSHGASAKLFTDSIRDTCAYTAFRCDSHDSFQRGKCLTCLPGIGCNRMGYWASPDKQLGSLYLNTQSMDIGKSMCLQKYRIRLESQSGQKKALGRFIFYIKTDLGKYSTAEVIDDSQIIFQSNSVETVLLSLAQPVQGEITNAFISYTRNMLNWSFFQYETVWIFKSIEIFSGETQKITKLCPAEKPFVGDTKIVKYNLC